MKLPFITLSVALAFNTLAQTPQLVYDIVPGGPDSSCYPGQLISFNNKLHFTATTYATDRQIWSYDGVGIPAQEFVQYGITDLLVRDLNGQLGVRVMGIMNNKLYFSGSNDPAVGTELMEYDGTNPPTLVADLEPGTFGSFPKHFETINGKLFFSVWIDGWELAIYDGSNPPTLYDLNPGSPSSNPFEFTELNGKVYFTANTVATGFEELFVYDPATGQVSVATEINPGPLSGKISDMTRMDDKIYFVAWTNDYGFELYSFDGSTATRITDLTAGTGMGAYTIVAAYNNCLYFSGMTDSTNDQLYKYDPANNNVALVHVINPVGPSAIDDGIVYNNNLYFWADNGSNGKELWMHDGANTTMVADIRPGSIGSHTYYNADLYCINNNILYFVANDGASGNELFSFTDPLTITNTKLNGSIGLSPNPTVTDATLSLSLKASMNLSISLTDASGKLVWEKATTKYPEGNTNVILPVAEKASGVYYYSVIDNNGVTMSSGKLVKQ